MEWAARLALLADIGEDRLGPGEEDGEDHPVLEAVMGDFDRAVRRVLKKLSQGVTVRGDFLFQVHSGPCFLLGPNCLFLFRSS